MDMPTAYPWRYDSGSSWESLGRCNPVVRDAASETSGQKEHHGQPCRWSLLQDWLGSMARECCRGGPDQSRRTGAAPVGTKYKGLF